MNDDMVTRRPRYEHKITLGNVLQIAAIVIGGVAIFFRLEGQVAINSERIAAAERLTQTQMTAIKESLAEIKQDLRSSRVTPMRLNGSMPSLRQGALDSGGVMR